MHIRVMKYSAAVRERAAPWWRSDTVIAACPAPTASLKQKPSTVLSLYCTAVHCAFTAPQYIALAGTAFSEVHCCFPTKTCFPKQCTAGGCPAGPLQCKHHLHRHSPVSNCRRKSSAEKLICTPPKVSDTVQSNVMQIGAIPSEMLQLQLQVTSSKCSFR